MAEPQHGQESATWTCPSCGRVCHSEDELKAHALTVHGDDDATYVRQLEDAVLALWAELPTAEVLSLREDCPALVAFVKHLHDSVEHEQAMVRNNVWSTR